MYCPWCGDEIVMVGRELTCRRGNMGLSIFLGSALKERFSPVASLESATSMSTGGFFCPGCGIPMIRVLGEEPIPTYTCPQCAKSIDRKIVYNLIEFHPHGYEVRGYKDAVRKAPLH